MPISEYSLEGATCTYRQFLAWLTLRLLRACYTPASSPPRPPQAVLPPGYQGACWPGSPLFRCLSFVSGVAMNRPHSLGFLAQAGSLRSIHLVFFASFKISCRFMCILPINTLACISLIRLQVCLLFFGKMYMG